MGFAQKLSSLANKLASTNVGKIFSIDSNGDAQIRNIPGVVGSMRNARMYTTVSSTATFTADEIIVETALAGVPYSLGNYNQVINLSITGAGGMDIGTAPVNGFVALYAIYNPTTGSTSILATNATASIAPSIYSGGNMPSGYTASALISVWPTNGSGLLVTGIQLDRSINTAPITILNSAVLNGSLTSLSISSAVPLNAVTCKPVVQLGNTATSTMGLTLTSSSLNIGFRNTVGTVTAGLTIAAAIPELALTVPQTLFYASSSTVGTPNFFSAVTGYSF